MFMFQDYVLYKGGLKMWPLSCVSSLSGQRQIGRVITQPGFRIPVELQVVGHKSEDHNSLLLIIFFESRIYSYLQSQPSP